MQMQSGTNAILEAFGEITKNLNSISLCLIHTHEAYLKYGVDFFLVCFGKVVKIKKLD